MQPAKGPKLMIIGPQSARAIVRTVERMPCSEGTPRRPPGNSHQRRTATRYKRRMWDSIVDLAKYATDEPQFPAGSIAGALETLERIA